MQDDLTITITINDELANYYFEKSPWLSTGSYKERFVGYSYLVKAEFNENITISNVITVSSGDSSNIETAVKVTGIGVSALEEVASHAGQLEVVASGTLGKVAVVGSKFLGIVGWFLTARDIINWIRAPTPSDGDDNNVIGG
jgi:hypothetical protein